MACPESAAISRAASAVSRERVAEAGKSAGWEEEGEAGRAEMGEGAAVPCPTKRAPRCA